MAQLSNYQDWVNKYFRQVALGMTQEYINGSRRGPKFIAHEFLSEEWTPTLTFESLSVNRSIVAADIVALDSSIPLKKRPSLEQTRGEVPKIGTKRTLIESEMVRLDILNQKNATAVADALSRDVKDCAEGIEATIEEMFLSALSTGVLLVHDTAGSNGVRVNFGYKPENQFVATTAGWANTATATPLDDIEQLFTKATADGTTITRLFISKKYMQYLRASQQGRLLYANNAGLVITDAANIGRVSEANMIEALKAEYGCDVTVVDQKIRIEGKDGKQSIVTPYQEENVVAVTTDRIGRIVYGTLAEENHPNANVTYSKAGSYTLISKYSLEDPIEEVTKGEAFAIVVIDNAADVYLLNAGSSDGGVIVDKDEIEAGKDGGKEVIKFKADSNVTASVSPTSAWLTTSVNQKGTLTVTIQANSGDARQAEITLTDAAGKTAKVKVSQQAGA